MIIIVGVGQQNTSLHERNETMMTDTLFTYELIDTVDIFTARNIVARLRSEGKHAYTELIGPIHETMEDNCPVNVIVRWMAV